MNRQKWREFGRFTVKVILVHILTYFVFGLVMSNVLDYKELFQREIIRDFMLPLDSHTLLGVLFQPLRGLLFAVALWPIRKVILEKKHGWLIVWLLFLVFGILSTTGAAPSSIEGVLFTKIPFWYHLIGLPEITLQTMVFSFLLVHWDKQQFTKTGSAREKDQRGFFSQLIKAIVVGCFAYIGYAIASLAIFFLSDAEIDFDTAAGDIKNQFMFVVAFVFNVIYVFFISKRWSEHKISLWVIFVLAWVLDILVLFSYQWMVFGSSALMTAGSIGLLPAAIIAVSVRQLYKRPKGT